MDIGQWVILASLVLCFSISMLGCCSFGLQPAEKDVLLSALCSIPNFIFGTELDQYAPVFLVDYQ